MILKELTLNNFLSHEKTTINFGETEKLLIDGRSGSGKSSITEAILWTLYGKGRSDNRSLIRRGNKNATVSLKLVDGLSETLITRTVSSTGKNTLTVTQNTGGEGQFLPIKTTGLKDTQNWIENTLLHASYELFVNSIAYPQDSDNSFVKASASKRKDLLLEIVRAGNFDELYEKTRKLISTLESENAVILSKISSLEESIKRNTEIASNLESYEKTYNESSYKLGGLEIEEKDLESKLHDISNSTDQISKNNRIIKILNDSISSIDIQLNLNNKQIEEHNKIDPEIFKKDIEELEKLSKEIGVIETELKESAETSQFMYSHMANRPQVFDYSKDIEEINNRLIPLVKDSNKCPAGDACPWIAPIQGQITYLSEQITDREDRSKKETEAFNKWEAIRVTIPAIKDTTELYRKLKEIQEKIQVLSKSKDLSTEYFIFKDKIEELNATQLSLRTEKDDKIKEVVEVEKSNKILEDNLIKFDVNKINADLSKVKISRQELQKMKDESSVEKQMAINAEKEVKDASSALLELNGSLKKTLEDSEALGLLKDALGPKGIKATVVDYIIPQLEEKINEILSQMSDFKIRLDTQTAKADDEGVKEGLFITIRNSEGQEMSYESFSGGEKIKITIAISEALASLLTSTIGFRIMDENILSLDKESTESFVDVLTKLQDKFPQLLIISHLSEIKDLFEKKITIIKINGVSKII